MSGPTVTVTPSTAAVTVTASGATVNVTAGQATVSVQPLAGGTVAATAVSYTPIDGTDWPNPDPTTVQGALDALAAGGIGGGGGGAVAVKEAGTEITAAASAIDFGAGFDVTESPAGEANVSLDLSEVSVPAASLTGTIDDARIPSGIARDSEVAAAYQPLDLDLTAIAALSTTTFGRNLLTLADAAALRTEAGLGGAATLNVGTGAGTVAAGDDSRITGAAQKASNLSDLASAATARTNLGLGALAVASPGNWKIVYTDGTGAGTGVALGSAGSVLTSNGASSAPSWGAVPESNLGLVMSRALFR